MLHSFVEFQVKLIDSNGMRISISSAVILDF